MARILTKLPALLLCLGPNTLVVVVPPLPIVSLLVCDQRAEVSTIVRSLHGPLVVVNLFIAIVNVVIVVARVVNSVPVSSMRGAAGDQKRGSRESHFDDGNQKRVLILHAIRSWLAKATFAARRIQEAIIGMTFETANRQNRLNSRQKCCISDQKSQDTRQLFLERFARKLARIYKAFKKYS